SQVGWFAASGAHCLQLFLEHLSPLIVPGNNEQSIVAGHSAYYFVPGLSVNANSNRLRAAGNSFDHQQVLRAAHLTHKFPDKTRDGGKRLRWPIAVAQNIAFGSLDQAKLVQVAGKRGLRDMEATPRQEPAQLLLIGQGPIMREFDNRLLPCQFCHTNNYAIVCINIQSSGRPVSTPKDKKK